MEITTILAYLLTFGVLVFIVWLIKKFLNLPDSPLFGCGCGGG